MMMPPELEHLPEYNINHIQPTLNVRWHKADITSVPIHVRYWG
jgi:hypothetical protein